MNTKTLITFGLFLLVLAGAFWAGRKTAPKVQIQPGAVSVPETKPLEPETLYLPRVLLRVDTLQWTDTLKTTDTLWRETKKVVGAAVFPNRWPHTGDSVLVDTAKMEATLIPFGFLPQNLSVDGLQKLKFGGFSAPRSIFEAELTIWTDGHPSGAIKAHNPFRPAWWVPGKVGVAARTNGEKGVTLGWPFP